MELDTSGIDNRAYDFEATVDDYHLVQTLYGGTPAIRKAGKRYLPAHEGEPPVSYKNRLSCAVLSNFFMDALRNISSRPFTRNISIKGADNLYLEDVTRSKVSFAEFSKDAFMAGIGYGECFVVCDFPRTNREVTLAEVREKNIRPFLRLVNPLSIFDYREDDGVCNYFRVATSRCEVSGFKKQTIAQIKVYEPGLISVYEKDTQGVWVLVGGIPIETGVPFVPVTRLVLGVELHDRRPVSPMIDCAHKQIEHYQVSVGLRANLDMTAYPMLAGQGMNDPQGPIPSGPGTVLFAPAGRWEILEPSGASYTSLQNRVNAIEREIQILGLQPLIPQSGNIAALVGEIQASKAHTAIRAWSLILEEKMEEMLRQMAAWLDSNTEIEVSIDTDFGLSDSTMKEVSQLIAAFTAGAIDSNTLLAELSKRSFLSTLATQGGNEAMPHPLPGEPVTPDRK
jgi:hypothetical protein